MRTAYGDTMKHETVKYRVLSFKGFHRYRVGTDGSFWRLNKNGWKQADLYKKTARYVQVSLYPGPEYHLLHRLVLEAFVGPCPEGMVCRHKNGNSKDNRLSNLAWGTYEENEKDKHTHGTRHTGENHHNAVLRNSDISKIHREYNKGKSVPELSKKYNTCIPTIWKIIRGESYIDAQPTKLPSIRHDWVKGSKRYNAKLTEKDIPEIRKAVKNGESHRSIAKRYKVAHGQIWQIVSGRAWKHVP